MLRAAKITLTWVWAAAIFCFGVALWREAAGLLDPLADILGTQPAALRPIARGTAIAAIAGSLFVFMVLVADDLFPRTPSAISGVLKAVAAAVMWGALAWAVWAACRVLF